MGGCRTDSVSAVHLPARVLGLQLLCSVSYMLQIYMLQSFNLFEIFLLCAMFITVLAWNLIFFQLHKFIYTPEDEVIISKHVKCKKYLPHLGSV